MDSSTSSTMKLVVPKLEMETEEVRIKCEPGPVKKPAPAGPYQKRRSLRTIAKRASVEALLARRRLKDAPRIENTSSGSQSIIIDLPPEGQQLFNLLTEEEIRAVMGRLDEYLLNSMARLSASELAAILDNSNGAL